MTHPLTTMSIPLTVIAAALTGVILVAAAILWACWSQLRLNYINKSNTITTDLKVAQSTITLLMSERDGALAARDKMRDDMNAALQRAEAEKSSAAECRLRAERAEHAYSATMSALGHQDRATTDRVAALERTNRYPPLG